jgi:hypothetical protein
MSRFLYGSSNVYRNFSRSSIGADHGLSLVECTKKAVFDAHISTLKISSGSLIVTAVLENFVMDACRGLRDEQVVLFSNQQITAHLETLANLVRDVPDAVALVSPLLHRRVPGWFRIYEKRTERIYFSLCLLPV